MKFSCVSLVIFLFCAFYTVLSVIVDQVYTLIFFFRQLIMINTYHFFLIVSIAYTKYLIAFSSILVLNLKKNSWKNRELSKMQFQKKMLNKNGWPPEDRKNFTLFVNFHFGNTFIKFPNLKHVYVYLTATDHVVYGVFSGQLVCQSYSPCISLDGSFLSPCGPKREAVTWCDIPSIKCLRYINLTLQYERAVLIRHSTLV